MLVSLPDVILPNRFSTRCFLVKPEPSSGMGRDPFRPISPKAVAAATDNKGDELSKNMPVYEGKHKHTYLCERNRSLERLLKRLNTR